MRNINEFSGNMVVVGCGHNASCLCHQHPPDNFYTIDIEPGMEPDVCMSIEDTLPEALTERFEICYAEALPRFVFEKDGYTNLLNLLKKDGLLITFIYEKDPLNEILYSHHPVFFEIRTVLSMGARIMIIPKNPDMAVNTVSHIMDNPSILTTLCSSRIHPGGTLKLYQGKHERRLSPYENNVLKKMPIYFDRDFLVQLQAILKNKPTMNESNAEQTLAELALSSQRFRYKRDWFIQSMHKFKHSPIHLPDLLTIENRHSKEQVLAILIVLNLFGPDDVTDHSGITAIQKSDSLVNLAAWGILPLTATEKLVQITQRIDECLMIMNTPFEEDQPLFDFGPASNYIPQGTHTPRVLGLSMFSRTASTTASSPKKTDPDPTNFGAK